ncbi:MAG: NAD-dependent epimerase/dehydratase family protein [Nanoarchaeota archaeon]|nr:NAD-dependent epimerase/dehydratase family protein [Nanoarchaeota archaeon]
MVQKLLDYGYEVSQINRETKNDELLVLIKDCSVIYYVAGINRPTRNVEYDSHLMDVLSFCQTYTLLENKPNLVYASSIQSGNGTPYGSNKATVESIFMEYIDHKKLRIERLYNVYGKLCKPNYNSVVSTFICNTISGKENVIENNRKLELIHIDDAIDVIMSGCLQRVSEVSVAHLDTMIKLIHSGDLELDSYLKKKLHSTYCSYLDNTPVTVEKFEDERGIFSTLYKNSDESMISVNVVNAGQRKGNHYHHTKVEEFTVLDGELIIHLVHVITGAEKRILLKPFNKVIISPLWNHTIINNTDKKALFLIWTNELYDPQNSDTWQKNK